MRRGRFGEVIERQLNLFEREHAHLFGEWAEAKAVYDRAPREEAEERYGDLMDVAETAAEALADLRGHYTWKLDEGVDEEYEQEFNRSAAKRFPHLTLELEDR